MFSSFGAMSFTGTLIYFDDVKDALRRFRRKIKSTILIYGSVARHGCGNDLDMIIVGTEEEWQRGFASCVSLSACCVAWCLSR